MKKAYTEKSFEKAVRQYFASISREEVLKDANGEPELNALGRPAVFTRWLFPPNLEGLRDDLGISRAEWEMYAGGTRDTKDGDPERVFSKTAERAEAKIEAFLARELLTRKSGFQGVILGMKSTRDRSCAGADGDADEDAPVLLSMTMEDRATLLRQLAQGPAHE